MICITASPLGKLWNLGNVMSLEFAIFMNDLYYTNLQFYIQTSQHFEAINEENAKTLK